MLKPSEHLKKCFDREHLLQRLTYPHRLRKLVGIPRKLLPEYRRRRVDKFKRQIAIASATLAQIMLLMLVLNIFEMLPTPPTSFEKCQVAIIIAELCVLLASRYTKRLFIIEILAYLTLLPITAMMFYYRFELLGYYIVLMFFGGLVYDWNSWEAALVTVVPTTVYYVINPVFDAAGGLVTDNNILMMVSFIVIPLFQFANDQSRRILFLLDQEREQAQRELVYSLELAAEVHDTIISHGYEDEHSRITVDYKPIQMIGGDYIRIFQLARQRTALLMADVTGHGVPAALMVNRMNTYVETLIARQPRPADGAAALNDFIHQTFSRTKRFMTAVWAEYDTAAKKMYLVNYGHPPVLHIRPATQTVTPFPATTHWMGISESSELKENEIACQPGDLFLLYTDGLSEIGYQGQPLGPDGLADLLAPALRGGVTDATDIIAQLDHLAVSESCKDDVLIAAWEIRG